MKDLKLIPGKGEEKRSEHIAVQTQFIEVHNGSGLIGTIYAHGKFYPLPKVISTTEVKLISQVMEYFWLFYNSLSSMQSKGGE